MPELLINDQNYWQQLGDGTAVHAGGTIRRLGGCLPSAKKYGEIRCARLFEDVAQLIPEDEWGDRIAELDARQAWLHDLVADVLPCKDQDGLGYCHAYGPVEAMEVQRAVQGHPYVRLSAESIGGPVVNWRNQGADPADDLEQLATVGACAQSFMDAEWSRSPARWRAGWKEDCANHRATEWIDLRVAGHEFEAFITAALLGWPGFAWWDWWRHCTSSGYKVRAADRSARRIYDRWAIENRNTWGPQYGIDGFYWHTGSKSVPSGAIALRQVTPSIAARARREGEVAVC